ncbi:MAG: hypothetical protein C4311_13525, partial [Chloroflexota bacterium]
MLLLLQVFGQAAVFVHDLRQALLLFLEAPGKLVVFLAQLGDLAQQGQVQDDEDDDKDQAEDGDGGCQRAPGQGQAAQEARRARCDGDGEG